MGLSWWGTELENIWVACVQPCCYREHVQRATEEVKNLREMDIL